MPTEERVYTEKDVWKVIGENLKFLENYILKELRRRGLGNKDAEQVFELTCETALSKPNATFAKGNPLGFMMGTAWNHINHIGRDSERIHGEDISDMLDWLPVGSGREITLGVEELLPADMPDEDKKIFIYKYKFGLTVEDIGELLRLKESTVKQRLSRGRQKMKKKHWFS